MAVKSNDYGRRVAVYIAGVKHVGIVTTALILNRLFAVLEFSPESGNKAKAPDR